MEYVAFLRQLGVPPEAIAVITGELELEGYEPVTNYEGLPPALLPIARTASGIVVGYWKHWFTNKRQLTIVDFFGITMFGCYNIAMERARNFQQFICMYCLEDIACDEAVKENVRNIAKYAGIDNLQEIAALSDQYGDDVSALLQLDIVRRDPPQACFEDLSLYPGDYPHPGMERDPEALRHACGYEIHSRFAGGKPDPLRYREYIAQRVESPPWLRVTDQPMVFRSMLATGDYLGAWMSLNSISWEGSDLLSATEELARQARNPDFAAYASIWARL